ncbi:response regulator transcription factor [Mangrovicoccus sp. HB161399]|uniref:response regulator n=1 Tax=Mangrovicoccus sp. HB161399 TaxID=2720392 RepID=UPI0015557A65|nr:response regulator transcription factor [Mangrovicoccus sp. HB161399]
MRILLVEDDDLVGDAICRGLGRGLADVAWLRTAAEASAAMAVGGFEVIVLDLGLPDGDGFDLLRGLRSGRDATPVLVLTARDGVEDRIRGLDLGADDYLLKPFDIRELGARCRALARRANGRAEDRIVVDGLCAEPASNAVTLDGRPLVLPRQEFRLLVCLMEQRGRVVSKDRIAELLYGWEEGAESNTVEVLISSLRRKVGAGRIRTLRGVGYMMP